MRDRRPSANVSAGFLLGLASVALGLWLFSQVRGLTFVGPEWQLAVQRRTWSLAGLLEPWHGGPGVVPISLYDLLFAWRGMLGYSPYAALLVAAHLAAGWTLFAAVFRRAGAGASLAAALVLLTLGAAHDVVLWPVEVGVPIAVGAGLLGWIAWDADGHSRRRDALGAGALLLAVASHPVGMIFLLAGTALVAVRRRKDGLVWPAVIGGLVVTWVLAFGLRAWSASDWGELVLGIPRVLNEGLSRTVGALSLAGPEISPLVAVVTAATLGLLVGRGLRPGHRFWIALASAIGVNLLAAGGVTEDGERGSAALYASVALLLVAAAELGRAAWPTLRGWRLRRACLGVALTWLVLVLVGGSTSLDGAAAARRVEAGEVRASLAALQLFASRAEARGDEVIDAELFGSMTYLQWAEVRAELGSPVAASVSSITSGSRAAREAADRLIFHLGAGALAPQLTEANPSGIPSAVFEPAGGAVLVDRRDGCSRFHVEGADAQVGVVLAAGQRLFMRSDGQGVSQVFYRLFAASPQESVSERLVMRTDSWYVVSPPQPPEGADWALRFDPPQDAQRAELCVGGPEPATPIGLRLEPVVEGLDRPLGFGHPSDGTNRLFVLEQSGLIRVIAEGRVRDEAFLDLRGRVATVLEQGLLGIAFHPSFARNGRVFVSYTDLDGSLVVAEFAADGAGRALDRSSERILLKIPRSRAVHIGGALAFGPDGYLYISSGDGSFEPAAGGAGMVPDPSTLLGVILRIDVDVAGSSPYGVPQGNPEIGARRSEVWAYGLRNPWRFSFDRQAGDLWIGDVGHVRREEVDFQPAGAAGGQNYGWSVMEGSRCYFDAACDRSGLVLPVADYLHAGGNCAITGGYVYRGRASPKLEGWYLFADFCSGRIWGMHGPGSTPVELGTTGVAIASFGEDDDGELYVAAYDSGAVLHITVEP